MNRWQLPDGIDELLPAQARRLEALRRRVLDLYATWGYELVVPPLMEFADSLLVGVGADLNLLTFKMPDQLSGRTLGLRADITPQVARMDAHSLAREGVTRLCYAGSVLHTRPTSPLGSRALVQVGAELYGVAGLDADVEVITLMLATLEAAGLACDSAGEITLDLGHGDVYRAIRDTLGIAAEAEPAIFDALQRKSRPDLDTATGALDAAGRGVLQSLMAMHGDEGVLERARDEIVPVVPAVTGALDTLRDLAARIRSAFPGVQIYFDLSELRGYHYHTGTVFAAYRRGDGNALANGGRYDNVGAAYGRARPATGFATDLKVLARLAAPEDGAESAIAAPAGPEADLRDEIRRLRAAGERVIVSLEGQRDARCDRELTREQGRWIVVPISAD